MSYTKAMGLLNRGPSRPTLFKVRLPGDKISAFSNDFLDFFCTAASVPEVRANTIAVAGHDYMGIVREQATAVMFGKPFTIEVISDANQIVYKELRNWFDLIAQNANQGLRTNRVQRMNYYDTYVSDIELVKMEQGLVTTNGSSLANIAVTNASSILEGVFGSGSYRETMRVNFINAYPISLGPIVLDTTTSNTYTKFQCQFTYESYNVI